jgi:MOSC domain-containing protein YiiM
MKIISINISSPKTIIFNKKKLNTSIFKKPTEDEVIVGPLGIKGDKQADLKAHGGTHKAIYAYSYKHYDHWGDCLKKNFSNSYGLMGENLTIDNFDEKEFYIGDQFNISNTILRITQPRIPCYKLGIKMNQRDFPKLFIDYGHLGMYMEVLKGGPISKGNDLELIHREEITMSVYEISKLIFDAKDNIDAMQKALKINCLSEEIKERFSSRLVKLGHYDAI